MNNSKRYYITTPIYYPSANPHVGTAYTTVLADILAKYKKLLGHEAFLTTGTDEHALKILINAKKVNKDPQEFVDEYSKVFKSLWKKLDINYDAFIRTSDIRHEKLIKKIYDKFDELGLIELKEWRGWYCNSCEENYAFNNIVKKDNRYYCNQGHLLVEKKEDSLFFNMSKFTDWINGFLFKTKPDLVYPIERRTELFNNFIKEGLENLSISRISSDWGIEVLLDKYNKNGEKHVAYVWVDALFSYLSALNYLEDNDALFKKFWNNDNVEIIHLMSKEITRFHAIYWPIFLHVLNLNTPSKILAHGWIITPEGKMSKSLGNVIDPYEYINQYGNEPLRFFFVKGLNFENDSVFSKDRFIEIYNTYLANTFGNLASRTHAMIKKYFYNKTPKVTNLNYYKHYFDLVYDSTFLINRNIDKNDLNAIVNEIYKINLMVNELIESEKPWILFKENNLDKLKELIHLLVYILRVTFFYLSPIIKNSSKEILNSFGMDLNNINIQNLNDIFSINNLDLKDLQIIFNRIKN